MSTIRIDKEHAKLLDKIIAYLTLKGKKISKKEFIGKLIENAASSEGLKSTEKLPPLERDPAWTGLKKTYSLGISDLSEKVDKYLYEIDED
ncbi:MAG: hypothetical protein GF317_16930 [Candidatus Lokiarchaeota archaeon]|nr:hypothetical protein [Candidatus Lokiarchaeota archaeon]MBD3201203.1 hypothetical protein [Candidatus Lokiarchaeota archaeon]